MATLPLFGSVNGPDLASAASQPGAGALSLLWFIPVAAAAVVGIAAWQRYAPAAMPSTRRTCAVVVLILALLIALTYLIPLIDLQAQLADSGATSLGISATTLTAAGYWIGLIGAFAAGAGGFMQLRAARVGQPGGGSGVRGSVKRSNREVRAPLHGQRIAASLAL